MKLLIAVIHAGSGRHDHPVSASGLSGQGTYRTLASGRHRQMERSWYPEMKADFTFDPITRADMAVIIGRIMNYRTVADAV